MAKKVSLKKMVENMMEAAKPVYQYTDKGINMTESSVKTENFRASFVHQSEDRQRVEIYLRSRALSVERGTVVTRHQLETRSNRFQKALAYIGEHRHLIPFLIYMYGDGDYDKEGSRSVRLSSYRKEHGRLPSEMDKPVRSPKLSEIHISRREDLTCVISQVPYIPKAWLL